MNEIITQNRPPASGVLSIDLETFSSVDLPKCGVYRYVESPDFEILLFAYAFDDEEVQIIDMAGGEAIPKEVLDALEDGSIIKAAWNAQFERTCLSKYLGHQLSPDSWRCSMVHAASLSLPLSLKEAAKVLKTGEQKDRAGENLIRYFSIPCKPTKSNGGRTRNLPEHDPEGWQQFKDYCLQDVRTERDIRRRLENFPLPDAEWDYYHMDQRINDRGVGIDTQLVTQAIACDLMLSDAMQKKAYELTGLENPNSVSQLKTWLEEKGIPMDSLGKKDVAAMIKELDRNGLDEEAMDMLKLRLQMAKSSVKKYQAAERCVCEDGRARGLFQFYGANRTGRFCLTGDHEVLTDTGWKRLDEWAGGRIACWNAASEAVSFQNAEQVSFDYEGPMYTYRDVRIDQCSTPDHKMRVQRYYGAQWQDMTVEEMAKCSPAIPFTGYRYHRGCANPAWLRVLIMTQADGYYTADGSVRYNFKKSRKVERCKSLLRKAEIPFVVNHYQNEVTAIDIPARAVPLWLRQFRTKTFGYWLLDENPDIFFEELPNWDGYYPAPNSIQYTTTNKQNADIVQALAHMSGRCCSVKRRHRPEYPEWKDAYYLNIWLTPGNAHTIKGKPEIMDFNGKVYCAVTKTGYFLVRRNGRVWVTGNSGRNIQLQNLPQNHIDTLDEARNLVKMGCFEAVEMLYGNTPDVLSQLIRTMLIPKEGCEFIVADFSAIEARVLAWEAGEQWRLDAFRNGADIYCESASQMFGVPVVKNGINGELRQKGKVAELACIAEGSLVLTDKGLVPIESVTEDHLVWDGEEFVQHEGIICKGEKEVIEYEGLTATPDHKVFVEGQKEPVYFGVAAACGAHLIQSGSGRTAIRLGEDYQPGKKMEQIVEPLLRSDRVYGVWCNPVVNPWESNQRLIKRLPILLSTEADSCVASQTTYCCKTAVRESDRPRLSQLRRSRCEIRFSRSDGGRALPNQKIWSAGQSDGNRQNKQRWELCSGKPSFCQSYGEQSKQAVNGSFTLRPRILAVCSIGSCSEAVIWIDTGGNHPGCGDSSVREKKKLAVYRGKVRVYDIRNAGRRHRFTVSGKLVHNCGYGGSSGALISMGALDMGLKESELPDLIQDWRSANPKIVQYWWDVEKAAVDTIKTHEPHRIGKIEFQYYSGTLWMVLPSGRKLAYLKPKLQPNRFGRMSVTFEGQGGTGNKWCRLETYSGKLVENCTQAIARDILVEAMYRMEKAGMEIIGHVHDEIIIEVPKGEYTVEKICKLMSVNPDWCRDLPLNAAGYKGSYYFKD